jgi:hypothetical protein
MAKRIPSSKKYEAKITAARKTGGNENQAHWESRLKAVMKRRKKPTPAK